LAVPTPRNSKKLALVAVLAIVAIVAVAGYAFLASQQKNGTKGTLASLDGRNYWSYTVPVEYNMTTLTFRGVRFDFAYAISEASFSAYTEISHGTTVTSPCPPGAMAGASLCSQFVPQVRVAFPDGTVEYFNQATAANKTLTYQPPSSYPWLSAHVSPQVAIMLNTDAPTASLSFYISA
jgi:hypothetical protein